MKQHSFLKRIHFWLPNPLSRWKKWQTFKLQHLLSDCTEECPVWQHQLCRAPCSPTPLVLFICISISQFCMSLLHWCGSKWPKATGFTMDTRSGATTQNKASSRELPTICFAEVTFYPGCAIAVIEIYFFPRLNMSWHLFWCVYIGVCVCTRAYVCVSI